VKYLGAYDANPAHLHPLPPTESATRYVEAMGGADAVVERAREAFAAGEYRWVAQLLDHVVFAEPSHQEARELAADALEQMGYQAESAPWRNVYLMGAQELRDGSPDFGRLGGGSASPDTVRAMPLSLFFTYLAVRLNGTEAGAIHLRLGFVLTDTRETVLCEVVDGGLVARVGGSIHDVDATVTLERAVLDRFVLGETTLHEEIDAGNVTVVPDDGPLRTLLDLLDTFSIWAPIIEP
jgi:alkyl sulfatase BDS1-like metallo-beta-lactamase superfamily hydrolase